MTSLNVPVVIRGGVFDDLDVDLDFALANDELTVTLTATAIGKGVRAKAGTRDSTTRSRTFPFAGGVPETPIDPLPTPGPRTIYLFQKTADIDVTPAEFLSSSSTSEGRDLATIDSDVRQYVSFAIPVQLGRLLEVGELDRNGNPNPFSSAIRHIWDPPVAGADDVMVDFDGQGNDYYRYRSNVTINEIALGLVYYRLTIG